MANLHPQLHPKHNFVFSMAEIWLKHLTLAPNLQHTQPLH